MDAIATLIQEHNSHRRLFDQDPVQVYPRLRDELIHHVNEEEEVLYSHLLELGVGEDEIRKAWEEHKLIMQLLQELDGLSRSDKNWLPKFETLKTLHLHHIDEEEKILFPKIDSALPEHKLHKLGHEIREQRKIKSANEILYPDEPGSNQEPPG